MTTENRDDKDFDESKTFEPGAARKADDAVGDAAQKYLGRLGIKFDPQQIEQSIREKPLNAVAIAAAAGFVIGSGMVTRLGLATFALFCRQTTRKPATNFVSRGLLTRPVYR